MHQNERLARQFYAVFSTGDVDILDQILARDWADAHLFQDNRLGAMVKSNDSGISDRFSRHPVHSRGCNRCC